MAIDTGAWPLALLAALVAGGLGLLLGARHGRARARGGDSAGLDTVLAAIGEGVIHSDAAGRVTALNPVAVKLTGWTAEAALGRSLGEVFQLRDAQGRQLPDPVAACLRSGQTLRCEGEHSLCRRDGQVFAVTHATLPLRGASDRLEGALLVFRDVSVLRGMERQLRHQASHDPLTGLLNRAAFEALLETVLGEARHDADRHHAL